MTPHSKPLELLIPKGARISFELPQGSGIIVVREHEFVIPSTSQAVADGTLEVENITLPPSDRRSFRLKLTRYFTKDGLKDICFDMGIDDENLSSSTKGALARELIKYCDQHGLIGQLKELCRQQFPKVDW